jgi:hypothetical protein
VSLQKLLDLVVGVLGQEDGFWLHKMTVVTWGTRDELLRDAVTSGAVDEVNPPIAAASETGTYQPRRVQLESYREPTIKSPVHGASSAAAGERATG